ncbi:MAG: hypothetical protein UY49_C0027G0002 [Microgenomates group bacterium GW2011_GWC1_49_7]|nr:MAG: hypothetical protein UY49_C0027G0002 [Microgenomates group bacterium GW2011_GWC1_49_7]
MRFPTKIPTLLGIILLVLTVGAVVAGFETYSRSVATASGSIRPDQVRITNVTDTMFTVSWTTELPATGAISLSSPKMNARVIFDEQDTIKQGKYTTHSVTFRSATPDTEYAVTILSNGKKHVDEGKPFQIQTAQSLSTSGTALDPAYGTIVTADNQPVRGALVYLTVERSQTLSTITKPSGTWLIPLNLIRTEDLSSYLPVTERMTETILVRGEGTETTAQSDTLNDSPVPDMSLGKTYDFRRLNAKAPGTEVAIRPSTTNPTGSPQPTPAAVLGTSTAKPSNIVALTIPAQGAALPTATPLIQGTGIPGKTVSITLGITNPIGGSALVARDGVWTYTPPRALAPGKQSVTITTQNSSNKPVAITHTFEILKSGTQVLGDATPSATLTPTATPTATLAATSSATPTPESTLAAQEVPTSGNQLPTIILLLLGIGLMVGGGIAFIK